MAELKTRPTRESVDEFLQGVQNDRRREDAIRVRKLFEEVTGKEAVMWGDSIVGFGSYRYTNSSGKDLEWMATGFSPRKNSLTLYIMSGFKQHEELMGRLGKFTTGKSCLYVKRLDDVDQDVLRDLIEASVESVGNREISY